MQLFAHLALAAVVAAEGPCDILGAAGNPCVAAHSTVRALYAKYDGPLYNVTRPNGKGGNVSKNIGVLSAGGFADVAAHEAFCAAGDCVISNVFDQSPQGNHLGKRHQLVNASKHKVFVGDNVPVYAMWFDPGYGYHVDNTTGIARGNESESIYAVMSGTHFNGGCCFDYGNSETNDTDDGAGTMEAIYFGNAQWRGQHGKAGTNGPWVGADLEQGMYFSGGENGSTCMVPDGDHSNPPGHWRENINNNSIPLPYPFVTAMLKGGVGFCLKGGDATKGTLTTMWDGPRPLSGGRAGPKHNGWHCGPYDHPYDPPKKQGAIILATGGDNSNGGAGVFYEGFMATGYATDATDEAVQANIVSVGYKNTTVA